MNTKYKHTLLHRNKKYDYKIWEEVSYNVIQGCEYSYYITTYNNEIIMNKIVDYKDVESFIKQRKIVE